MPSSSSSSTIGGRTLLFWATVAQLPVPTWPQHALVACAHSLDVPSNTSHCSRSVGCNRPNITDAAGSLSDGSDAAMYAADIDCGRIIRVAPGHFIAFTITDLGLGHVGDSLTVYDGDSTDAPEVLSAEWWTPHPTTVFSAGSDLFVRFVSERTPAQRADRGGFSATWTSANASYQTPPCAFGICSRRRDCHSAAPPSPFSRRFNMDGEEVLAK